MVYSRLMYRVRNASWMYVSSTTTTATSAVVIRLSCLCNILDLAKRSLQFTCQNSDYSLLLSSFFLWFLFSLLFWCLLLLEFWSTVLHVSRSSCFLRSEDWMFIYIHVVLSVSRPLAWSTHSEELTRHHSNEVAGSEICNFEIWGWPYEHQCKVGSGQRNIIILCISGLISVDSDNLSLRTERGPISVSYKQHIASWQPEDDSCGMLVWLILDWWV